MKHKDVIETMQQLYRNNDPDILQKCVALLRDRCEGWNWVGIYLLSGSELVLGPYVGKPTEHTHIAIGVGVCGSAVKENQNIIVDDVTKRDNYLACTLETRAELVVLIRHNDQIVGQFDIDSDKVGAFSSGDEQLLEALVPYVSAACRAAATASSA